MKGKVLLLFYMITLFFVTSCVSESEKVIVEQTVDEFYKDISVKDYEAVYNLYDDKFKTQTSMKTAESVFLKIDSICGNYKSRKQMSWEITTGTDTDAKVYHYSFVVTYANKTCKEDLYLILDDKNVTVGHYDVAPQ